MFEGEGAEKRVGKVGGDACLARTGVDGGSGMTGAGRLAFFLGDSPYNRFIDFILCIALIAGVWSVKNNSILLKAIIIMHCNLF